MCIKAANDQQSSSLMLVERDHRKIEEILEALNYHLQPGQEQNQVKPLLNHLAQVVALHFALEDGLMAASHYTRLPVHRLEHARLMSRLGGLCQVFGAGGPAAAMQPVSEFLGEHEAHLLSEDAHYGLWLNACEGRGGRVDE